MSGRARTNFTLRVIVYFARNPGEYLTPSDIREKFGGPKKDSAGSALRGVLRNGTLRVWKEEGVGRVYGAGPTLLAMVKETA